MDALILAAGYGMRMENLTKDTPKPLLKIKNKTLISYAIDLIKNMSFDKIYINTHYKHNMLEKFVSENYPDISISYEETILGTGGGIKNIQRNDTVILNTDNLWDQSFENELKKSIKFFDENKNFDSVLLINSKNNNFDLEVNNEGLINFPSKLCNTSFQGCHIIRKNSLHPYPEIFNIQDFWKDCSLNEKIYGYETTIINAHVGTKDEYLKYK
jgi:MurNAc alpha-1-phosphate uridylyltransferase|tara:strand:- start:116 stop:757 length:642 start_codon:yes stop_codon:yes gene_type:complete